VLLYCVHNGLNFPHFALGVKISANEKKEKKDHDAQKKIAASEFYSSALLKCCNGCQFSWNTNVIKEFYQEHIEKDP
jgi:hypothetical protein